MIRILNAFIIVCLLTSSQVHATCSAALKQAYGLFESYSQNAYRNLSTASPLETDLIYHVIDTLFLPTNAGTLEKLKAEVIESDLSHEKKTHLIDALGLDLESASLAKEKTNQSFGYLFWADHSYKHVEDVLSINQTLRQRIPPIFSNRYKSVFENTEMNQILTNAIEIHDSFMGVSRAQHAAMLIAIPDSRLSDNLTSHQKMMTKLIATLHSKSLMSDEKLADFRLNLVNDVLPKLSAQKLIAPHESFRMRRFIEQLSKNEIDQIRLAVEWIRIADVLRATGTRFTNSLGFYFSTQPENEKIELIAPDRRFVLPKSQADLSLANLAVEKVLFEEVDHKLKIIFELNLPLNERENIVPVLNTHVKRIGTHPELYIEVSKLIKNRLERSLLFHAGYVLTDFPHMLINDAVIEFR